jgi:hypothetical protein
MSVISIEDMIHDPSGLWNQLSVCVEVISEASKTEYEVAMSNSRGVGPAMRRNTNQRRYPTSLMIAGLDAWDKYLDFYPSHIDITIMYTMRSSSPYSLLAFSLAENSTKIYSNFLR